MPFLPAKQCTHPGCPWVGRGVCPTHDRLKKKQYYANRNKSWQHLYNYRWEKYSKGRLRRHPLCVTCLNDGKTTAARVTDHIIPHKGSIKLFWDHTNHESLCKTCHDKKTAGEGAFGNEHKINDTFNNR